MTEQQLLAEMGALAARVADRAGPDPYAQIAEWRTIAASLVATNACLQDFARGQRDLVKEMMGYDLDDELARDFGLDAA